MTKLGVAFGRKAQTRPGGEPPAAAFQTATAFILGRL
jgi:hypothetical protein